MYYFYNMLDPLSFGIWFKPFFFVPMFFTFPNPMSYLTDIRGHPPLVQGINIWVHVLSSRGMALKAKTHYYKKPGTVKFKGLAPPSSPLIITFSLHHLRFERDSGLSTKGQDNWCTTQGISLFNFQEQLLTPGIYQRWIPTVERWFLGFSHGKRMAPFACMEWFVELKIDSHYLANPFFEKLLAQPNLSTKCPTVHNY